MIQAHATNYKQDKRVIFASSATEKCLDMPRQDAAFRHGAYAARRGSRHPKKGHPRFMLHFTPTSSSWLNLVERWFLHLEELGAADTKCLGHAPGDLDQPTVDGADVSHQVTRELLACSFGSRDGPKAPQQCPRRLGRERRLGPSGNKIP